MSKSINYIVYDRSTGEIARSGVCVDTDLQAQARGNLVAMEDTDLNTRDSDYTIDLSSGHAERKRKPK